MFPHLPARFLQASDLHLRLGTEEAPGFPASDPKPPLAGASGRGIHALADPLLTCQVSEREDCQETCGSPSPSRSPPLPLPPSGHSSKDIRHHFPAQPLSLVPQDSLWEAKFLLLTFTTVLSLSPSPTQNYVYDVKSPFKRHLSLNVVCTYDGM